MIATSAVRPQRSGAKFLLPTTLEVWGRYYFHRRVSFILSIGSVVERGVCYRGGIEGCGIEGCLNRGCRPRGVSTQRECVTRGCPGDICQEQGCLPRGCLPRHPFTLMQTSPTGRQTPPPQEDNCGDRYASYWNAFKFDRISPRTA